MKLLVLTSEPVSAQQLRDALPGDADPTDAEVMVVAPALQSSPLRFWVSDTDEAIARAEQVRRESLEQLGAEGVSASGDTGESDPLLAIQDALITFPADRIVLFTHGGGGRGYREDVDPEEVRRRFGLPVDQAGVSGSAADD
ncbi:MAG: hypothetical protein JO179_02620 [Solirubrobacterales bacterium]|nr:hypothetical protein [Solirubrobacterales bacterium]